MPKFFLFYAKNANSDILNAKVFLWNLTLVFPGNLKQSKKHILILHFQMNQQF